MNKSPIDKIYQLWKDNAEIYKDKSTIWIIQMTADMAGVEYMDVAIAIREGKNNDKN